MIIFMLSLKQKQKNPKKKYYQTTRKFTRQCILQIMCHKDMTFIVLKVSKIFYMNMILREIKKSSQPPHPPPHPPPQPPPPHPPPPQPPLPQPALPQAAAPHAAAPQPLFGSSFVLGAPQEKR